MQAIFLEYGNYSVYDSRMRIGTVLNLWRAGGDLTLKQAAEELGIPFQTLSRIENGSKIDGKTLSKLFHYLFG